MESAEYPVAFLRVSYRHDSLSKDIARAEIEFATRLVAKIDQVLARKVSPVNRRAVESVLVEPLAVIAAFECAAFESFLIGFGSGIRHNRVELRRVRVQLLCVVECHAERFRRVARVTDHEASVDKEARLARVPHKFNRLVRVLYALVDVLQNFGTCAFEPDAHFASASPVHQLQKFERHVGAGITAPRDFQLATQDLFADFLDVSVVGGKRVVLEKDFA